MTDWQICEECQNGFRVPPAMRARRFTCSRACGYRRLSRIKAGRVPFQAAAARHQGHLATFRASLRKHFGELSVREIELFRAIYWTAYNQGYERGRRRRDRQAAA